MNSRERVRCVLNRQIPDSVPRGLYDAMIDLYNDSTLEFFQQKAGKHPRDCFRHDIRGTFSALRQLNKVKSEFAPDGLRWRQKIGRVSTVAELEKTGFYEYLLAPQYTLAEIQAVLAPIHGAGFASIIGCFYLAQQAWGLRGGMANFLMDLMDRPPWLDVLLNWITEAHIAEARLLAQAGPDILCLGDDIATQHGLLFSPALWHEVFLPRWARIVAAVKETNPSVAVFFHCCGNVTELIPGLIAAGIDILNPLQPEAMDVADIKRRYGGRLIFWGGLGVQSTLSQGTPADVDSAVKNLMATVGAGGGYILSPAHMINPDISWENIVAFFEAAERYGNYR